MDRVVIPVVRAFAPDAIVAQCGVDHHHADPLSHMLTTMPLYPDLWDRLVGLADEVCDGRLVALGGGGYEPCTAPPRAWALLAARMAGAEAGAIRCPESGAGSPSTPAAPSPPTAGSRTAGPTPTPPATPAPPPGRGRHPAEPHRPVAFFPLGAPAGS